MELSEDTLRGTTPIHDTQFQTNSIMLDLQYAVICLEVPTRTLTFIFLLKQFALLGHHKVREVKKNLKD